MDLHNHHTTWSSQGMQSPHQPKCPKERRSGAAARCMYLGHSSHTINATFRSSGLRRKTGQTRH